MKAGLEAHIYTDGGARGNPGPAAIGVVIFSPGSDILYEGGKTIGQATNNVAEYRALIEGLKQAQALGAKRAQCFMDSELAVKQMRGEYKIKNHNLQKLCDQAQFEVKKFESVSFTHVRREHERMRRADQLVNHALDDDKRKQMGW